MIDSYDQGVDSYNNGSGTFAANSDYLGYELNIQLNSNYSSWEGPGEPPNVTFFNIIKFRDSNNNQVLRNNGYQFTIIGHGQVAPWMVNCSLSNSSHPGNGGEHVNFQAIELVDTLAVVGHGPENNTTINDTADAMSCWSK